MPSTPKIEATAVALAEFLAEFSLPSTLMATKMPISEARQNAANEARRMFFLFIRSPIRVEALWLWGQLLLGSRDQ